MRFAALEGDVEIVKLCEEQRISMKLSSAALEGHIEIVKLCKEYGATDFDSAMRSAAFMGRVEIVKLCRECGADGFRRRYGLSSGERPRRDCQTVPRVGGNGCP